jgi:tRNA (cmo5U34)-methyltransferase
MSHSVRRQSHSVRRHLRVEVDAYDETIRRFIPGYETMLATVARAVAAGGPGLVLDLGAGTGALSEAILQHDAVGAIELVDVDREMLDQARARLARFGSRARFREQSFLDPLPACDAVTASLALHHIPEMDAKGALYRRIHASLRPGGVFVNADAVMPADARGREAGYAVWAAHMVSRGIPEERAWQHFAEWAEEDTYQPIEQELAAMAAAGFETGIALHEGPLAVLVGQGR